MIKKRDYSDKLLVKELSEDNEKAFRVLFDMYRQDIYSYSISILKHKLYAEEIVQDVFLKVWMHRDRLNPDLSFKSYIFTIARNLSFNFLSKAANDKILREAVFYKSQKLYNHIDDILLDADYKKIREEAIDQLTPNRRVIFEMSRNEGKSYLAISQELGISINTVKNQMSKALETIRSFLLVNGDITLIITIMSSGWLEM